MHQSEPGRIGKMAATKKAVARNDVGAEWEAASSGRG